MSWTDDTNDNTEQEEKLIALGLMDVENELRKNNKLVADLKKEQREQYFPTLIVIQEWWGLDAQTKSIADRFAKEGYLAFAPDLYHGEIAKLGDGSAAAALTQKYGPT